MHTPRNARAYGKVILGMSAAALVLAGCSQSSPKLAATAPAAPVGHVYPVAVDVPPPVSPRIKFTPAQEEKVQQAFNVIGLKSALMVAALSCDERSQYDAFMNMFHPHVLDAQHQMDAYFYKASGPYSGRKMEDTYITLLANNQSVAGIGQGSVFCVNNDAEFKAVLALKTPEALDSFVTDEPPGQTAKPKTAKLQNAELASTTK
ncbi:MAG: hypothetical protein KGQ79_00970 [Proteobacteria bacterium]|nr:hypothetical protein [Pseudomonadota bacterium]MBU6425178.1 hypothetical protein [Rhodospirillales bacterium]